MNTAEKVASDPPWFVEDAEGRIVPSAYYQRILDSQDRRNRIALAILAAVALGVSLYAFDAGAYIGATGELLIGAFAAYMAAGKAPPPR